MNFIRFDCPGCGQNMEAEEDAQFAQVKCPTCQHEFFPDKTRLVRPAPTSPAPPPPTEPKEVPKFTLPQPASSPSGNLRFCMDCGGKVSVHAETCPHCGAPMIKKDPDTKHWTTGRMILLIIFIVTVLATLIFIIVSGGLLGLTAG
jgi:DNA-directed RNA polymerase subunit RPC12/RpoP